MYYGESIGGRQFVCSVEVACFSECPLREVPLCTFFNNHTHNNHSKHFSKQSKNNMQPQASHLAILKTGTDCGGPWDIPLPWPNAEDKIFQIHCHTLCQTEPIHIAILAHSHYIITYIYYIPALQIATILLLTTLSTKMLNGG